MMQRDSLNDRDRQPPKAKQVRANLRMSAAKDLLLRLPERNAIVSLQLNCSGKFFRDAGQKNELAHVVQQPGGERLLDAVVLKVFDFANPVCEPSHSPAMRPKCLERTVILPN